MTPSASSGFRISSLLHFVAETPDGFDQIASLAEFCAQSGYMGINCSCITDVIVVPDVFQEDIAALQSPRTFRKVDQQLELGCSQDNFFSFDSNQVPCRIDGNSPDPEYFFRMRGWFRTPENGFYPEREFPVGEGFNHVVVRSDLKTYHPIDFFPLCR